MICLDCGGKDWIGWVFTPWGKANTWRLESPFGHHFTPLEIIQLHDAHLNNDWLKQRIKKLESERDAAAIHFSKPEIQIILQTLAILRRELPEITVTSWRQPR